MNNKFFFFLKKLDRIYIFYFLFSIYFIVKSLFFYFLGVDNLIYIQTFTGANSFFLESLPMYLIVISQILNKGNYAMYYRYHSRSEIFNYYYKKSLKYTLLYILTYHLIIVAFASLLYGAYSVDLIINLAIIFIKQLLSYLIILNSTLYLAQLNNKKTYNTLYIYLFFIIENYVLFEGIFSKRIPLTVTWIYFNKISPIIIISILLIINIIIFKLAYNKSFEREFA